MEEDKANPLPNLLCCQNENGDPHTDLRNLYKGTSHCFFYFFLSWLSLQMVPLMKSSCDTLVEKLGEFAESGKSLDVFRYGS